VVDVVAEVRGYFGAYGALHRGSVSDVLTVVNHEFVLICLGSLKNFVKNLLGY
jgi:hypothetical protein